MPANYCSNCGELLRKEAHFCPQCGAAIQSGEDNAGRIEACSGAQERPALSEDVRQWTQMGPPGAMQSQEDSRTRQSLTGLGESILDGYSPLGAAQRFGELMAASCSNTPLDLPQWKTGALNRSLNRFSVANQDQAAKPQRGLSQILGVWFYQLQTAYGPLNYQLIMDQSMRFGCQCNMNGLMGYDSGIYQHQEGFLHFVVRDHEPKFLNGRRQHWITSWGYHYTVVDPNNMIFEDRLVGGRFKVVRVQNQ